MSTYETVSPLLISEQTLQVNGTTGTEGVNHQSQMLQVIKLTLNSVFCPAILLIGFFGNLMTIYLTKSTKMFFGDPSIRLYFMFLAVCDQTVLILGLGRKWIVSIFEYDVRISHVIVCKLHKFLVFSVGRAASWILVAMTLQRVLTFTKPSKLELFVQGAEKKAKVVTFVILVLCCLADSQVLVMYDIKTTGVLTKCKAVKDTPQAKYYQDNIVPWLNSITAFFLPFAILVVNNSILIYKLRQLRRCDITLESPLPTSQSKKVIVLSYTLIATSIAFIVFTSPIIFTFIIEHFGMASTSSAKQKAKFELATSVLDLLWYCNSAVNFYLYFLTSQAFRRRVIYLLCGYGEPDCHSSSQSRQAMAAASIF